MHHLFIFSIHQVLLQQLILLISTPHLLIITNHTRTHAHTHTHTEASVSLSPSSPPSGLQLHDTPRSLLRSPCHDIPRKQSGPSGCVTASSFCSLLSCSHSLPVCFDGSHKISVARFQKLDHCFRIIIIIQPQGIVFVEQVF